MRAIFSNIALILFSSFDIQQQQNTLVVPNVLCVRLLHIGLAASAVVVAVDSPSCSSRQTKEFNFNIHETFLTNQSFGRYFSI